MIKRIKDKIVSFWQYLKNNRLVVLKHVIILSGIVVMSFIINFILSLFLSDSILAHVNRTIFIIVSGLAIYFLILFRGNVEKTFLSLSLSIGILYIIAIPSMVRVTWDDESHFYTALEQSVIINVPITPSLLEFRLSEPIGFQDPSKFFNSESYLNFLREMNSPEKNVVIDVVPKDYSYFQYSIGHIPAGIMIFIGRNLNLPASAVFDMGRLGILLVFSFAVYAAIKRLSSGKHIMAIIALFPTVIFQATNYSIDSWVIALVMLGLAYFFYEIQHPDAIISKKSMIIMFSAFVLGLAPKAIYFLIMGLLYLMPKSKFENNKDYKRYIIVLTVLIAMVVGSFLIPFIVTRGGDGDMRGSLAVGPRAQVMFILQNPLTYATIVFNFFMDYFSFNNSRDYMTFFAYLGYVPNTTLIWLLLGFAVITDKNPLDSHTTNIKYKIIVLFIFFATATLFTTAMYISFTSVGALVPAGVQGRYILPLLFPLFFVIGSSKTRNELNKKIYSPVILSLMSFVLLRAIWVAAVSKYY